MAEKYLVSETLKYSDGSVTVVDFKKPENATEIEAEAAEMVKINRSDEVTASAPVALVDEETVSSTFDVPDEVEEEEIAD